MKALLRSCGLLLLILIFLSPLWLKLIPIKNISGLIGKSSVVDKVLCNFSVKVNGQSLMPIISAGETLNLSRCFEIADLREGSLVTFYENASLRFGIIRHILPLDPPVFKVSNEKTPELFHDLLAEEIVAMTNDIDTGGSKYQASQDTESFIIKPGDYISDFYLAKIPKGMGLENSSLEKTSVFIRSSDKFCAAILPKQKLMNVDIEVVNNQTQEKISLEKNIIFDTSLKPNINCLDFALNNKETSGTLSLNEGNYQLRLLLNHQILTSVNFEVK